MVDTRLSVPCAEKLLSVEFSVVLIFCRHFHTLDNLFSLTSTYDVLIVRIGISISKVKRHKNANEKKTHITGIDIDNRIELINKLNENEERVYLYLYTMSARTANYLVKTRHIGVVSRSQGCRKPENLILSSDCLHSHIKSHLKF